MEATAWQALGFPAFLEQFEKLNQRVKALRARDPQSYDSHPSAKLLFAIHYHIRVAIPRNPNSPEFRQGNTLGPAYRSWFRAKFHGCYRLFYRFSSEQRIIIYAWVNDERTLRKQGSKTDPYAIFRAMLDANNPPTSFEELLRTANEIPLE